jgi:hypothetical protein
MLKGEVFMIPKGPFHVVTLESKYEFGPANGDGFRQMRRNNQFLGYACILGSGTDLGGGMYILDYEGRLVPEYSLIYEMRINGQLEPGISTLIVHVEMPQKVA